ncbi:MAG TPA: hypothetical protein VGQ59_01160 [Cyclobacteriaceae bacterium]|jgi:hypothetical protein|nr:hypothetical protein [Cyclobacteriaceae bacterium]
MRKYFFLLALISASSLCSGQTKVYLTGGYFSYQYHNVNYYSQLTPPLFVGLEVDKYIGYHYAITTGINYFRAGYDDYYITNDTRINYQWKNNFLQIPLGIKLASKGDILGIMVGVNFNVLLNSSLHELADSLNNYTNYITTDVTSAFSRIQPDFFFGLQGRASRFTVSLRISTSLTNRYSTKVKDITDNTSAYYGSYYAYILGKEEDNKLKTFGAQLSLSIRLF